MNNTQDPPGQQYFEGCEPPDPIVEPQPAARNSGTYRVKFESLDLRNFRNHQELHLTLKPVTLITGPNGSGKSSVQMALEWLLSGRCAVTNERGQGAVGREGAEPSVSATVPGGGTISRCGNKLACSWAPGSKYPETDMAPVVGCSPDRARLALQAGRFFRLEADARKALLYDLLDLHVQPKEVEELLKREGAPLRLALDVVGHGNLAQLSLAHKKLFDRRRDVNREADVWAKSIKVADEARAAGDVGWQSDEEIQALLEQDKDLATRERDLMASERDAKAQLADMRRRLEEMEANAERFGNHCTQCGHPSPAKVQLETEGGLLRAAIATAGDRLPAFIDQVQAGLEDAAAKRAAIREQIQTSRTLRESMTTLNTNREKLKRLRDEAADLNLLLPYFAEGPTGIMARQIRPKIANFEAQLNAVGAPWGLEFRYEDGTKPEIRQFSTHWVPYEALSDGQQIMASLAHQVVFARKFGLGVVCLDRIEALDPTNRAKLLDICAGLVGDPESGVLQILLFGVVEVTSEFRRCLADWANHYELSDHALNYVGF